MEKRRFVNCRDAERHRRPPRPATRPGDRVRRHASVGIGGLTLDGGIGYLVRKHGLTIDDRLLRSSPRMGSSGTRTLSATRTCSG
jgi:hypothetical protein